MYGRSYSEMRDTANEYFDKFTERFEKEYKAYQNGAYTDDQFIAWYRTQIERGEGYNTMADKLAERMTNANVLASAYINDATPSIYSLNRDYEAYRISEAYGVDFQLTDEMTVRRLMNFDNHIEFRTTGINRLKDYEWNREQIHNALVAGILQGKSIDKLADSYMVVMKRNRASAIRNARTSFTSAQNAGRLETYYRADAMGIDLKKEWLSAHDARVRDSHGRLDGERVDYDKAFSNKLLYPADPKGAPAEVYNCRCTMRAILPDINDQPRKTFKQWQKENERKAIESKQK